MTKGSQVDQDLIRAIAELLNEQDLAEIELEREDFRIRVTRAFAAKEIVQMAAPAPTTASTATAASSASAPPAQGAAVGTDDLAANPGTLTSPMVGTAYHAAEPGAKPFVDIGTHVSEGQTVLIIEAMKTMNQIPAHRSGTIRQILVEDAQPVEYGEPLLVIE